jgi:hypothetical protein
MLNNQDNRLTGLSAQSLRTWGIIAIVAGVVSKGFIQMGILGIAQMSVQNMMDAMENPSYMGLATIALILNAIEACAIPIFSFLLVEGFTKSKNRKFYFLRVFAVALISEIPFDLIYSGKIIATNQQNPVFAVLITMILLYFFKRYQGKQLPQILLKLVILVAAIFWMEMLKIYNGTCFVVISAALWLLKDKKLLRTFGGCCAAALCTVISPFYLAAPVAFLAIHFYNEEQGAVNKLVNYIVYPAVLVIFAAVIHLM